MLDLDRPAWPPPPLPAEGARGAAEGPLHGVRGAAAASLPRGRGGLGAFVRRRIPHRLLVGVLAGGAEAAREARARKAVEGLLATAVVASLVLSAVESRGPQPGARGPPPPALRSLPVDVASDPPWRLGLLPGLGPVRAEAILLDRARRGPVPSVDALTRVRGFGRKTVEGLKAAGAVVGPARPGAVASASDAPAAAGAR